MSKLQRLRRFIIGESSSAEMREQLRREREESVQKGQGDAGVETRMADRRQPWAERNRRTVHHTPPRYTAYKTTPMYHEYPAQRPRSISETLESVGSNDRVQFWQPALGKEEGAGTQYRGQWRTDDGGISAWWLLALGFILKAIWIAFGGPQQSIGGGG